MGGRETRPGACTWVGGDTSTRHGCRADAISSGNKLDGLLTVSHGGNCGTTANVDGTAVKGHDPNETRYVAMGSN